MTLVSDASILLRKSDKNSPGQWQRGQKAKYKSSTDSDDPKVLYRASIYCRVLVSVLETSISLMISRAGPFRLSTICLLYSFSENSHLVITNFPWSIQFSMVSSPAGVGIVPENVLKRWCALLSLWGLTVFSRISPIARMIDKGIGIGTKREQSL